jgi:hypothetical protein
MMSLSSSTNVVDIVNFKGKLSRYCSYCLLSPVTISNKAAVSTDPCFWGKKSMVFDTLVLSVAKKSF